MCVNAKHHIRIGLKERRTCVQSAGNTSYLSGSRISAALWLKCVIIQTRMPGHLFVGYLSRCHVPATPLRHKYWPLSHDMYHRVAAQMMSSHFGKFIAFSALASYGLLWMASIAQSQVNGS